MPIVAYKYRLYPTAEQTAQIERTFGCVRYVYNAMLERQKKVYARRGEHLSYYDMQNLLPEMKQYLSWLSEVDSQALQQVCRQLDAAYKRFFGKQGRFPRFKTKSASKQSYTTTQISVLAVESGCVKLPKLGWVKAKTTRLPTEKIKRATVSRNARGKYFVSVTAEEAKEQLPRSDKAVGVDLGYRALATLSNGTVYENPKALHASLKKLARAQRKLSRKKMGSRNRKKQQKRVAALHEKVANQRRDNIQKVTTSIIRENQTICLEDLDVISMLKDKYTARFDCDVGFGEFRREIEYKASWYGRDVSFVSTEYPSSKRCSCCGSVNEKLSSQKFWTCPRCGTRHDRDRNAAINILEEGLRRRGSAA